MPGARLGRGGCPLPPGRLQPSQDSIKSSSVNYYKLHYPYMCDFSHCENTVPVVIIKHVQYISTIVSVHVHTVQYDFNNP